MQTSKSAVTLAKKQIKLLSGQDYFRNDEDLIEILTAALIRHADDEAHMQRIVATWIDRTRQALHPADVPGLAAETTNRKPLPDGCEVCKGEAFVHNEAKGGMQRCNCERGRALAASDAQVKAKDAQQRLVGGVP